MTCAIAARRAAFLASSTVSHPIPEPARSDLCFPESMWAEGRSTVWDPSRRAYWQPWVGTLPGHAPDCARRAGTGIPPPVNGFDPVGSTEGIETHITEHRVMCPKRTFESYTRNGKGILEGRK